MSGDQGRIDDWVNEAYEDVLVKSRCKVSSTSVTGASADYTLSSDVLAIIDLYTTHGTQSYPMERVSVDEILHLRRSGTGTAPTRYYALAGHDLILFYPDPSNTDSFTMYYVDRPTALSASGDSPSAIPQEWHKLIEWYALAEGADFDDDESSVHGDRYRALYEDGLRKFRKAMRWKGGYRVAPGIAGRRRRRIVPNHPSEDIW